ncbi:MAG TPA: CHAT domain-containing protein [Chloroflexaceae bacterium]|nr:CHAT domain-containing protein [Chloroflexaceae bacterium]
MSRRAPDDNPLPLHVTFRHGVEQATAEVDLDLARLRQLAPSPPQYGQALMGMLLAPQTLASFLLKLLGELRVHHGATLAVQLVIATPESQLHNLHWETLTLPPHYFGGSPVTLSRSAHFHFARRQQVPEVARFPPAPPRPRALMYIASPSDLASWQLDSFDVPLQRRVLGRALSWARVDERLSNGDRPPTEKQLEDDLQSHYDLVCLFCHGKLTAGGPVLYLENGSGQTAGVPQQRLVELFAQGHRPRLLVIGSCQSADHGAAHASLAHALIESGIPAVIAFKEPLGIDDASTYLSTLFQRIFMGSDVATAAREARIALGAERGWWQPILLLQEPVALLKLDHDRVRFAQWLARRVDGPAKAERCAAVARLLREAGHPPYAGDESPLALAGAALSIPLELARQLRQVLVGATPAPGPTLGEHPGEQELTLVDRRIFLASELAQIVSRHVPERRAIRTLYQVWHQYGRIPDPPPHAPPQLQAELAALAALPDEPSPHRLIASPLLTYASWIGEPDPDGRLDEALLGQLDGWQATLRGLMGWSPQQIQVPRRRWREPDPRLFLTIRLSAHNQRPSRPSNGAWSTRPRRGQAISASAWLWCSELLLGVPVAWPGQGEPYSLDGASLRSLCEDVLKPLGHVLERYDGRLMIEWVVPWQWLDWPFVEEVRHTGELWSEPLNDRHPFLVRLDHRQRGSLWRPSSVRQARFNEQRGMPIQDHELLVCAGPQDCHRSSDAEVEGREAAAPLGLIITRALQLAPTDQAKKELAALLRSEASILLWPRAARSAQGASPDAPAPDLTPHLTQLVLGRHPARPPRSRADVVLLWDDLARIPPHTQAKAPYRD